MEDTDLYDTADWDTFRSVFGLNRYSAGSLTQVHPAGTLACSAPGISSGSGGTDTEAAADVEWATAAAPGAAIVVAACADTATNFGGLIALQNMLSNGPLPGIVSISYGEAEVLAGTAFNSYINLLYQTAAAAGVSVFVSSGDSGAATVDAGSPEAIYGISVSGWASTPYNVAVGGTDFADYNFAVSHFWGNNDQYYGSAKSYIPEMPWNDTCGSGVTAGYLYSLGYINTPTTYGLNGLCNDSSYYFLTNTVAAGGGPSACVAGSPTVANATSGTCSGYVKPSWQSVYGNPSDGVRDIPDVALFAADGLWGHYYVTCFSDLANNGAPCTGAPSTWAGGGGTSFSAPIMAGIQALINQATGTKAGNPNPAYYQIAQSAYSTASGRSSCNSLSPSSACTFNDVTTGDITVPCAGTFNCFLSGQALGVLSTSSTSYEPAYAAASGWDFATGLGSVNAFNLLQAFTATIAPANLSVALTAGGAFTQGQSGATYTITVSSGTAATSGTVTVTAILPSGLTAVSMAGDRLELRFERLFPRRLARRFLKLSRNHAHGGRSGQCRFASADHSGGCGRGGGGRDGHGFHGHPPARRALLVHPQLRRTGLHSSRRNRNYFRHGRERLRLDRVGPGQPDLGVYYIRRKRRRERHGHLHGGSKWRRRALRHAHGRRNIVHRAAGRRGGGQRRFRRIHGASRSGRRLDHNYYAGQHRRDGGGGGLELLR